MKIDDNELVKQVQQEFEEEWKSFPVFKSLPKSLQPIVDKLIKPYYLVFYVKGYKNGWKTCSLYPLTKS